jgi:hypothetical protein
MLCALRSGKRKAQTLGRTHPAPQHEVSWCRPVVLNSSSCYGHAVTNMIQWLVHRYVELVRLVLDDTTFGCCTEGNHLLYAIDGALKMPVLACLYALER